MRKKFILICCMVVATSMSYIRISEARELPIYVPGEVLVKFTPGSSMQEVQAILGQIGAGIIKKFSFMVIYNIKIPANLPVEMAIRFLRADPRVVYAEPNYYRYLNLTPNDPQYSQMWGLNNSGQTGGVLDADIDAPEAWNIQTGSPSIVVVDIDSGMDLIHEDLAVNLWTNPGEIPGNGVDDDGNGFIDDIHGWDVIDNDNDPTDTSPSCGGHGTHTAGTIGAVGNNGKGVVGVNWNLRIMPLRVFGGFLCSGSDANIISAIEYYTGFGVRVSNNSYGGGPFNQAQEDAIRASQSLFVAAAGNGGFDGRGHNNDVTPEYPASYPLDNIISVAATDDNDAKAGFSNFGITSVDLGAPGVDILSTLPGNAYGLLSGTSMATPHVTGAAALLLAQDSTLTNYEVKWRLLKGTDFKGYTVLTKGRLNIFKALTLNPQIIIDVTPLGPTDINPGDTVQYRVTIINLSGFPKTVTRKIYARHPDGMEGDLEAEATIDLNGGQTLIQNFTVVIPSIVPPSHFGAHDLVGRIWTSGFADFSEDEVLYNILP